jgi:methionyl-tRNA formyltransferase
MSSITILITDERHPIQPWLRSWAEQHRGKADIQIVGHSSQAAGGDILFLVSCQELVKAPIRERYTHTLVLHASDLPQGKGMSPHVWQILEGRTELVVTLLEAVDALDSGSIWRQQRVHVPRTALHAEINALLFEAELELMTWALVHNQTVVPQPQVGNETFYRKRVPDDSRINPDTSLGEAFNLLRIADPDRYPAFFEIEGVRFKIRIERM